MPMFQNTHIFKEIYLKSNEKLKKIGELKPKSCLNLVFIEGSFSYL